MTQPAKPFRIPLVELADWLEKYDCKLLRIEWTGGMVDGWGVGELRAVVVRNGKLA